MEPGPGEAAERARAAAIASCSAEAGTAQLRPKRSAGSRPFFTFLKTAILLIPNRSAASGIE